MWCTYIPTDVRGDATWIYFKSLQCEQWPRDGVSSRRHFLLPASALCPWRWPGDMRRVPLVYQHDAGAPLFLGTVLAIQGMASKERGTS